MDKVKEEYVHGNMEVIWGERCLLFLNCDYECENIN